MPNSISSLFITIAMAHAMIHNSHSQAPAAARGAAPLDCADALLNLTACLTYIEEGSTLRRPKKGCCSSLASLVKHEPLCLCQFIGDDGSSFGVRIDTTKSLMLSTACRVATPPTSLCAVVEIPMASPTTASGGPEEPGSSPSLERGMPKATPPNSSNGDPFFGAFDLFLFVALSYSTFMAIL